MNIGSDRMREMKIGNQKFYEVNRDGKTLTLPSIAIKEAEKNGISVDVLIRRISDGWAWEEATTKPSKPHEIVTEVFGEELSLSEISEEYGIARGTLYKRYKAGLKDEALVSFEGLHIDRFKNDEYIDQEKLDERYKKNQKAIKRQKIKRSKENVAKHRVCSDYFTNLVTNNLFMKIKTDKYGRVQRG